MWWLVLFSLWEVVLCSTLKKHKLWHCTKVQYHVIYEWMDWPFCTVEECLLTLIISMHFFLCILLAFGETISYLLCSLELQSGVAVWRAFSTYVSCLYNSFSWMQVWVWYKESSWASRIIWTILLISFGRYYVSLMSSEIAFRTESSRTFHQMLAAMQFWGFMCGFKCRLHQEMDQLMIAIPGEEAKLIFC
jgi:hypothetical protein